MRDYGLPPTIWGGDTECEHDWGDEIYGSSQSGSLVGSTLEGAPAGKERRPAWSSAFCRRCNAWRGCLGLEPDVDLYVAHMVEVFREVRRVLRKDGTVWLNLGDAYAGSMKGIGANGTAYGGPKQRTNAGSIGLPIQGKRITRGAPDICPSGLKPKDLIGMPWMLAFALRADGWWLRSDIIWAKPNPMPESVTDRPTRSHEYLFLLTKSARYYFDQKAVREPQTGNAHSRGTENGNAAYQTARDSYYGFRSPNVEVAGGRNIRTVWTIPTQPTPEAHFATFPEALVEPCVRAGTSERGCCAECGAPYIRDKWYNGKRENVSGVRADSSTRELPSAESQVPDVRGSGTLPAKARQSLAGAPDSEGLSRITRHRSSGTQADLSADADGQGQNAGGQQALRPDGQGAGDQAPEPEALCADREWTHHGPFTGSPSASTTSGGSGIIYDGRLEQDSTESEESVRLLPNEVLEGAACDDRPSDTVEPGRDTRRGEYRGGVSPLQFAQAQSLDGWRPSCKHGGEPIPCRVLDPFSGAGTTGVVAAKLRRDYIGIELNPDYNAIAERRIKKAVKERDYGVEPAREIERGQASFL